MMKPYFIVKPKSIDKSKLNKPQKMALDDFLKWPGWVCIPVLLIATINFVELVSKTFNPLQLDYSEGLVISGVHRILSHPSLATTYDFNPAFYNTTDLAYPPVFPYLAALITRILSWLPGMGDPDSLTTPLFAMRGLTLASLLGCGWFIYFIVRLFKASRLISLTAASLFFCFHPVIYWGSNGRVDSLGLVFVLAGMYLIGRAEVKKANSLVVLWAIPLFALAFFTKQSLVAAPVAVVIYLAVSGRKKQAAIFTGLSGLVYGAGLATLVVITRGNYLFFMTMERFTPFSLTEVLKIWGLSLVLYGPLILVAVLNAPPFIKKGGLERLLIFWGIAAVLVSFTVGKVGAADYYFFEVLAVLCIITAKTGLMSFTKIASVPSPFPDAGKGVRGLGLKLLLALQLLLFLGVAVWLFTQYQHQDNLELAYQKASRYLEQYSTKDQKIFVELSGPALAVGRFDDVFDHFIYRQLAAANVRDGQGLVQDVVQQKFKVMLMGYDVLQTESKPVLLSPWPPGFEEAIRQHYRLVEALRGKDGQSYAWILIPIELN